MTGLALPQRAVQSRASGIRTEDFSYLLVYCSIATHSPVFLSVIITHLQGKYHEVEESSNGIGISL